MFVSASCRELKKIKLEPVATLKEMPKDNRFTRAITVAYMQMSLFIITTK